jgi:hypothetical protein
MCFSEIFRENIYKSVANVSPFEKRSWDLVKIDFFLRKQNESGDFREIFAADFREFHKNSMC